MGDTKKKKNRERKLGFYLMLGEEEMELLKRKAEGFHISRSDYLRSLIVHGSVKAQSRLTNEQFQAFLNEMNHIGVNINQIAYRVNAARSANREDFNDLKTEFENLLNLYRLWAQY